MTFGKDTRRTTACAVAGFLTFLNLYAPQAFLKPMAAGLDASPVEIGLAVTVSLLAVATFAPIAGAISDRYGRKNIVVGAAISLTISALLVAQSGSLVELLVWRTLQGVLLPFIFSVTVAYINDECPGIEGVKTSGYYISGTIVGGATGRLLGGAIAGLASWRLSFAGLAVLTGLSMAFVAALLPREERFRPVIGGMSATLRAYAVHLRNIRLLSVCVLGFCMMMAMVGAFSFITFRLAGPPFDLSPTQASLVFSVYFLAVVTTPLAKWLVAAMGRLPAFLIATVAAALGLGLTLTSSVAAVWLGMALVVSGLLMVQALAISFIGVVVPQARSSAVGLYVTSYYIGGSCGSVLPGMVMNLYGWTATIFFFWAFLAVMAANVLAFWRVKTVQGGRAPNQ
jgi:MFS transporter, YNFM family, putative membrane transport protein